MLFVDDVIFAQPNDFFARPGQKPGKYVPFESPDKRGAFKRDLSKVVDLLLAGKENDAKKLGEAQIATVVAQTFPSIALKDIEGKDVTPGDLRGKAVVVETWATWCPPCRATLKWLETVLPKYSGKLVVLAIAVDSPLDQIQSFVKESDIHSRIVNGTPAIESAFSNINSVPQVYLYDGEGKLKNMIIGAPPEAHDEIEAGIKACLATNNLARS